MSDNDHSTLAERLYGLGEPTPRPEGFEVARRLEESSAIREVPGLVHAEDQPDSWTQLNGKRYSRLPSVELPARPPQPISVENALRNRSSCRSFGNEAGDGSAIGWALAAAAGITGQDGRVRRPYPSAGMRWPIEWYLAASNVDGIAPGVYHVPGKDSRASVLLGGDPWPRLKPAFAHQPLEGDPAAVVVLTGAMWRSWAKYGARGSSFAHAEAGAAAMAFTMAAESAGLGVVWLGGFVDHVVAELLDLRWEIEMERPLLCLAVGRPEPEALRAGVADDHRVLLGDTGHDQRREQPPQPSG